MKKFSKVLSLVLVVAMVAAFALVPAMAVDSYTITIDNAVKGETYSAYKVFDVTYSGTNTGYNAPTAATDIPGTPDAGHQHTAYSYTISNNSLFWTDLTTGVTADANGVYSLTSYGFKFVPTTTSGVYNVIPIEETGVTDAQAQALAAFLATKLTGKSPAASEQATADTNAHDDYATGSLELDVTSSGAGYYFVDTSTGSLCSLDTTEPSATIREKNSIPGETKTVTDGEDASTSQDAADGSSTTVKIGDTVTFTITVTDSKGTDKPITVHDIMSDGLTLDVDSFALTGPKDVSGTKTAAQTLVAGTDYTIKIKSGIPMKDSTPLATGTTIGTMTDSCSFEIVLSEAYVTYLAENDVVTITYDAELNKDAETATPYETNKTTLEYSEQNTHEIETTVKTYEGDIVKTDASNNILDGATFKIYNAATAGTEYQFVMVGTPVSPATTTGIYEIKSSDNTGTVAEKLVPLNGKLTLKGLENGSYYIEEVDHPEGYNPLTSRESLVINNANNSASITGTTYTDGGTQVINRSGTELPSTGGIGTTIFYIVGALLVCGAGIVLITRRRVQA